MPGVFITEGMALKLSNIGIRVMDDGRMEMSPITIAVAMDIWPMWLDVAIDNARSATDWRTTLASELGPDRTPLSDPHRQAMLLNEQCKSAMVSICASAFALDNFYACIADFVPGGEALRSQWDAARTARHKRVSESMRRTFKVTNEGGKYLQTKMQEVFKFRDWAVHPPSDFREAHYNDLIDAGTDWRFVAFRAENASHAAVFAASSISQCLKAPRRSVIELGNWAQERVERSEARAQRAAALLGP